MSTRLRDRSKTRDSGAVAVTVAVVLAFVMVPLSGLATTTFVRAATAGQLQRAADSGALRGAAAIPLGDLAFVTAYLSATSGGATAPLTALFASGQDPLTLACNEAVAAASQPDSLGADYALPYGSPSCTASYLSDAAFGTALSGCIGALPVPTLLVPDFGRVLPALLRPGVRVDLSWQVRPPLSSLSGADDGAAHEQATTARARRRFKNAVVVPLVGTLPAIVGGGSINLNPTLSTTRAAVLQRLDDLHDLAAALPVMDQCANVFSGLADDFADAVNPPDGDVVSTSEVLADALSQEAPVNVLRTTTVLGIPFLDFVSVCVERVSPPLARPVSFGGCLASTPGGFRATLVDV